ncbi:MAG: hypothetical protein Q7U26_08865 [Aquabacterium sp.]|nr:hypothetical protein [Aquabacterium sp.]
MTPVHDVARIRLDNAMRLFDEFVQAAVKHPDAAALRGLERRFAERLQIQPSYWSQIKGRSRQIGERLARQFEQLCRKPVGWMDVPHDGAATADAPLTSPAPQPGAPAPSPSQPQDDDERFIVGLVLTYYRRHPQRARTRLLDLLGEVLTPPAAEPVRGKAAPAPGGVRGSSPPPPSPAPVVDDRALWSRIQTGVAPLKPKR